MNKSKKFTEGKKKSRGVVVVLSQKYFIFYSLLFYVLFIPYGM